MNMFQKPAFGANTSGFGMQSTFGASTSSTASPFGGFKPGAATSAFGAPPAFGAATSSQPATGGGLFGSSSTTGGLFGGTSTAAPAPAFGAPAGGFSFGAGPSAGTGGLFASNTSTGLFGNTQQSNAFGAKPAGGFGFGSTTTNQNQSSGLFGATSTAGTSLFGQQTTTLGGGGLFSTTAGGFGQQQQTGTGHVKYSPVVGTDVVIKSGTSQTINIKHHCITCMKEYESKSLEELRLEDYTAGRKGSSGGMFPLQQQQGAKPLFGGSTTFGQPATTSAPSVFGGGALTTGGGFGQNSSFSFGNNTQTSANTSGLFGANKPAFGAATNTGTGLFGAPATTQAPAFGTNTSSAFGFGSTLQNQTSTGGLFGAKPATSVFGAQPASTGFGGFGTGGLFGAKPLQTQAPTFGAPQPGIGTQALGFGTNTSTSGGLFGGANAFGKPATTQPTFGFGTAPQPLTLGGGLGGNAFQNKTATQPFGGTSMFQTPNTNTFRTGLDSGLGGGMFGNSGSLGGSGLGLGLGANNSALANLSGSSAAGNVHEQILTLAARPYGDSPLFKDLLPDNSSSAEEALRPTNPAALQAVLDRGAHRVSSPAGTRLKLRPRDAGDNDKKSLFDGLEESDASLEDKLSLKPSRKRLVLRPNQRVSDSRNDSDGPSHRSLEEQAAPAPDKENAPVSRGDDSLPAPTNHSYADNNNTNNLDVSSDRQGSWLGLSKLSWSDNKEKPIDDEPTPRLYPTLDKDLPAEGSERRASWLTTKPLRKPLAPAAQCESSVRDLGVRPAATSRGHKEDLQQDVSDEAPPPKRDAPPHPAGVKLTRPGYYTIPSLDEMVGYMRSDGTCVVPHLTIGRTNYGNVYYDSEVNVTGLDLDELVHFLNKEVIVYPEDADKPPVGEGLNKRAIVTLDRIWPRDKTENKPITDPDRLWEYERKLRRVCEKHDTKFIEYRPQTGSWVFRVEHFSKYGLTDSDEEDDITPEVLRRQLTTQQLQRSAPPGVKPPVSAASAGLGGLSSPGLGGLSAPGLGGLSSPGLGGLSSPGLGGLSSPGLGGAAVSLPGLSGAGTDNILAMQQTSLNLLNGARTFEMETTEDNAESQSLYQDNKASFGVKSPTSELARLEHRRSHHVQLMKASLYADTEMEDDMSSSTGDQLVPMSAPPQGGEAAPAPPLSSLHGGDSVDVPASDLPTTDESQMRPLIVEPHTIVLKYHRKVPPFKNTIAGRLDAACMADMSISRSRHTRAGFGANGTIAFVTSYDSIVHQPKAAELCDLDKYLAGRGPSDWSEPLAARMALHHPDPGYSVQDILGRHLETLYHHSELVEEGLCPRLRMLESPRERHAALKGLLTDAALARTHKRRFGVSGAYCYEVWQLCDALWGADLENDGVPGTDDISIVNRHRKFLEWMTSAVAEITDEELSKPTKGETEDELDGHSGRVWTLMLGGRVLEACKLAREKGDLNLAALIAQAAGDPTFRSLVRRQLSLWRECGADSLVASHKLAALRLAAGAPPLDHLALADWRHALHATARYLCPQVPSLEQVVRTYEGFFVVPPSSEAAGAARASEAAEAVDLTSVDSDATSMQFPLPPYATDYDLVVNRNGRQRRVLDLRYELIRARAFNTRPALRPGNYTRDPLDHSLSFVLGTWLGDQSGEESSRAADQLEAAGAWHLAVQALCYHPDERARAHLIKNVLSRNAPAKVDSPELEARLELMRKLRIPEKWLLLAQAHRAKYERLPLLEAEYLAGAEQWNASHKVVMEELVPDAVLSDTLRSVGELLERMCAAARRHELSGWERGGEAPYLYLRVCDEIRGLVSSAEAPRGRAGVQARLEALRPAVAAACRALAKLKTKGGGGAAARAEMGARLVQLAVAAGEGVRPLAALLRALDLPPDCTATAQHKITTDLAEQASEMCIESASSSPISSHHRATAAS